VLQDAGIKLTSVASHTYSKSARAMLEALLSGVTDPEQLAELAKSRMRPKIPQLREALASRFEIEHRGVMVAQLLAHIDTLDAAIQNLNERIDVVLAPHAQIVELLCTIPGVQTHAAQVLIAECGLDMTRFPTVGHFASWAGACPGHHESAGRRRSGQTRPGPRWLTDALTECAKAAARTKGTYLAAHFAQLRGRRGEPKAIGALRHDILVAYYHIVRDRVPIPRARTRLATQALLRRAPRPPTAAPTRGARLHGHGRSNRRDPTRHLNTRDRTRAGLTVGALTDDNYCCPNAAANSTGIHRTVSLTACAATSEQ